MFEASHALIFRLFTEGLIDGVRIDHVDGLAEPREYCQRLRQRLDELAPQRPQRCRTGARISSSRRFWRAASRCADDWQVDGTTGYDFMNDVGALLARSAAAPSRSRARGPRCPGAAPISPTKRSSRDARSWRRTSRRNWIARRARCIGSPAIRPTTRDFTFSSLRRVVGELVVHFPVYRIYPRERRAQRRRRTSISRRRWTARARRCRARIMSCSIASTQWLGGSAGRGAHREAARARRRTRTRPQPGRGPGQHAASSGAQRRSAQTLFSQLTSPVAAKASKIRRAIATDVCCRAMKSAPIRANSRCRSSSFTRAIWSARRRSRTRCSRPRRTTTSAAKTCARGIAVLSEIRRRMGRRRCALVDAERAAVASRHADQQREPGRATNWAPGPAAEAMLYQTLVGCWPPGCRADDEAGVKELAERVAQWQLKALREAKLQTSWLAPDEAYEAACREFPLRHRRAAAARRLSARVAGVRRRGSRGPARSTASSRRCCGSRRRACPIFIRAPSCGTSVLSIPTIDGRWISQQRRTWLAEGEEKGPPSEQSDELARRAREARAGAARARVAARMRRRCLRRASICRWRCAGAHAAAVIAFAAACGQRVCCRDRERGLRSALLVEGR